MATDHRLDDVRERREELLAGMAALEAALAAPGSDTRWRDRLGDAVAGLRQTLHDHVTTTEAEDGFLSRVRADAPRLSNQVDRLVADHDRLTADTVRLMEALEQVQGQPAPTQVDSLRDQAVGLLAALVRHRQRGSDVIYEAYQVDVGGPG